MKPSQNLTSKSNMSQKTHLVADAMSRFSYTASKAFQDCSWHGSLQNSQDMKKIIQEEFLEEHAQNDQICPTLIQNDSQVSNLESKFQHEKAAVNFIHSLLDDISTSVPSIHHLSLVIPSNKGAMVRVITRSGKNVQGDSDPSTGSGDPPAPPPPPPTPPPGF